MSLLIPPSPPNCQDVLKYHSWSPVLVIFSNCGQKQLTKQCALASGGNSNAKCHRNRPPALAQLLSELAH